MAMRVPLAADWDVDVERGPDWLIVHLRSPYPALWPDEPGQLAQQLWQFCQQHFTFRLVVDLDEVALLTSYLLGQLITLENWLSQRGGVLRLCGLTARQVEVLSRCRLEKKLLVYPTPYEAVLGCCRPKPK